MGLSLAPRLSKRSVSTNFCTKSIVYTNFLTVACKLLFPLEGPGTLRDENPRKMGEKKIPSPCRDQCRVTVESLEHPVLFWSRPSQSRHSVLEVGTVHWTYPWLTWTFLCPCSNLFQRLRVLVLCHVLYQTKLLPVVGESLPKKCVVFFPPFWGNLGATFPTFGGRSEKWGICQTEFLPVVGPTYFGWQAMTCSLTASQESSMGTPNISSESRTDP